jgi:hypothetical protein
LQAVVTDIADEVLGEYFPGDVDEVWTKVVSSRDFSEYMERLAKAAGDARMANKGFPFKKVSTCFTHPRSACHVTLCIHPLFISAISPQGTETVVIAALRNRIRCKLTYRKRKAGIQASANRKVKHLFKSKAAPSEVRSPAACAPTWPY